MNGLILYESKLLALLYTVFIFLSDTEKANFLCWLDVSNPVWLSLMPLSGSFHFLGEPIFEFTGGLQVPSAYILLNPGEEIFPLHRPGKKAGHTALDISS